MTKKLIAAAVLMVALAAASVQSVSAAALMSAPSSGATVQERKAPVDGNGAQFMLASDLGYKVAVFTSDTQNAAALLVDEAGNTVTCAQVHAICIADDALNANNVTAYDTSSVAANAYDTAKTASIRQIMVPLWATDTTKVGQNCSILDVQVNAGLAISQKKGNTGSSNIYWRPCSGKRG